MGYNGKIRGYIEEKEEYASLLTRWCSSELNALPGIMVKDRLDSNITSGY